MLHYLLSLKMKKTSIAEISKAVEGIGGEIISLEYSMKYFGNIILIFKKNGKEYKYVVDRGEIYFNKQMVCSGSYFREEGKKPYQKLIEIMRETAN